jgi:two-component system phosphate regulon response regulator PhoB
VLVVDDEPSIRLLCRVNLELAGYEVGEAENGKQALARAQEGGFGLILLDVMMPDIGGHDVARRLAGDERTRDIPVVFLSARAERENLRFGYELGAVDYITKPFDPIELEARVTQAIERVERGESEGIRTERLADLEK